MPLLLRGVVLIIDYAAGSADGAVDAIRRRLVPSILNVAVGVIDRAFKAAAAVVVDLGQAVRMRVGGAVDHVLVSDLLCDGVHALTSQPSDIHKVRLPYCG